MSIQFTKEKRFEEDIYSKFYLVDTSGGGQDDSPEKRCKKTVLLGNDFWKFWCMLFVYVLLMMISCFVGAYVTTFTGELWQLFAAIIQLIVGVCFLGVCVKISQKAMKKHEVSSVVRKARSKVLFGFSLYILSSIIVMSMNARYFLNADLLAGGGLFSAIGMIIVFIGLLQFVFEELELYNEEEKDKKIIITYLTPTTIGFLIFSFLSNVNWLNIVCAVVMIIVCALWVDFMLSYGNIFQTKNVKLNKFVAGTVWIMIIIINAFILYFICSRFGLIAPVVAVMMEGLVGVIIKKGVKHL